MRRRFINNISESNGEVTFTVQMRDGRVETYTIPQMSWAEFIGSEYNLTTPLGEKYYVIGNYGSVQVLCTYDPEFTDTEYNELYYIDSLQTVYPDDTIISTTYINL